MMNMFLSYIIACCFLQNPIQDSTQNIYRSIKYIDIVYLSWECETFVPINCDGIDHPSNNSGIGHLIILQDSEYFKRILDEIKNLRITDKYDKPNVRVKVGIVYFDDKKDVLCIGMNRIITLNGKNKCYSDSLEKLIRSAIPISYYDN